MRHSSLKIQQWGIASAWLSRDHDNAFVIYCNERGAMIVVARESGRSATETVTDDEDVSRAAVRAISRLR